MSLASSDWHQLVDLCALSDTLVIEQDGRLRFPTVERCAALGDERIDGRIRAGTDSATGTTGPPWRRNEAKAERLVACQRTAQCVRAALPSPLSSRPVPMVVRKCPNRAPRGRMKRNLTCPVRRGVGLLSFLSSCRRSARHQLQRLRACDGRRHRDDSAARRACRVSAGCCPY